MLAMSAQLQIYEQMYALSAKMVEAARLQDWDRLIELERTVAGLREKLIAEPEAATMDACEVEKKRALIQQILQDDAEVRRHTEPWMEQVRRFLSGDVRKQQVDRAYGAGS